MKLQTSRRIFASSTAVCHLIVMVTVPLPRPAQPLGLAAAAALAAAAVELQPRRGLGSHHHRHRRVSRTRVLQEGQLSTHGEGWTLFTIKGGQEVTLAMWQVPVSSSHLKALQRLAWASACWHIEAQARADPLCRLPVTALSQLPR